MTDDDAERPSAPRDDEPTVQGSTSGTLDTGQAWTSVNPYRPEEPTVAPPVADQPDDTEDTVFVRDEATTTGPTVGGWPFDEPAPESAPNLVWQPEHRPPAPTRSPAYYVSLGAAVVLVVVVVAAVSVLTVVRPNRQVAGVAAPTGGLPEITAPTTTPPRPTGTSGRQPPRGPFAEVAAHPLSASASTMAPSTCALPRFDVADDAQARFYVAAKVCADDAWRGLLADAGIDAGDIKVVTVAGAVASTPCGDVKPTDATRQCADTVYLTPAHLRDGERNDRYPGRYLGVFLREYARALQYTSGMVDLVADVTTGSEEDIDNRLSQQATCLAGIAAGAMAGLGAVDDNISGEIRDRLTSVDAPPDAERWLVRGIDERQPAACNTWK